MWEDGELGLSHLGRWERIAVVASEPWVRHAVNVFGYLSPERSKCATSKTKPTRQPGSPPEPPLSLPRARKERPPLRAALPPDTTDSQSARPSTNKDIVQAAAAIGDANRTGRANDRKAQYLSIQGRRSVRRTLGRGR